MSSQIHISKADYDGVLFDLDGVVTDTARLHQLSWKAVFDHFLGIWGQKRQNYVEPFDPYSDYLEYLDGKDRYEGAASFLRAREIKLPLGNPTDTIKAKTICGLGNKKNCLFLAQLAQNGVEVFATTVALMHNLKRAGIKLGVVSSSKNCQDILQRAKLTHLFDARVDGIQSIKHSLPGKPRPDMYLEAARRLGISPLRTAVVEDASCGIEAAHRGGFALVLGVARHSNHETLKAKGADYVVNDLAQVSASLLPARPRIRNILNLPSALDRLASIHNTLGRQKVFVFLDYDGTLAPIASRPEAAILSSASRKTLSLLAESYPVAIITGRDRPDVENLVNLTTLYYAGCHGFDIAGPEGSHVRHKVGRTSLRQLDQLEADLASWIRDTAGARIERKTFAIAVHFRNVDPSQRTQLDRNIAKVHPHQRGLRLHEGNALYEFRPNVNWNKADAVQWLLKTVMPNTPRVTPIYIGDDTADEEVFHYLQDFGITIKVAGEHSHTAAQYTLANTREVRQFMDAISAVAQNKPDSQSLRRDEQS